MSLLVFEHTPTENSALLGRALHEVGHRLRIARLFAGDQVPRDLDDIEGIVSMGGPMNVDQADRYPWLEQEIQCLSAAHGAGVPIVGVCLGAQLIAAALGGRVEAMAEPEIGWHGVDLTFPGTVDPVYAGIGWHTTPFHIHGQQVTELPEGGVPLAKSQRCKIQAFKVGLTTYGFQYHFEWDRQGIAKALTDPIVTEAGLSSQQLMLPGSGVYDDYRRLGDRLCQNIATNLFPVTAKLRRALTQRPKAG